MENLKIINELFEATNLQSFLISIAAGATWDAVKHVMNMKDDKYSIEIQVLKIVNTTMQQFYSYKKFTEYDEQIVMDEFCKQYVSHCKDKNKKNLRSIVEETIYCKLTDSEFEQWIELFVCNCVNYEKVINWIKIRETQDKAFTKRNHIILRMESKLKEFVDEEYVLDSSQYKSVFECINKLFCSSWKDDLLCLLRKLSPSEYNRVRFDDKMEFICSEENCDLIITQVKELITLCNIEKKDLETKKQIFEFLKRPHYDKVLVVTGTPGAGKTFFIEEYIKYSIDLLECERRNVVIPCVIDGSKIGNCMHFEQTIFTEFSDFIGEHVSSFEQACILLENLSSNKCTIKICFIIDNLHSCVDNISDWKKIVKIIECFSKYEMFKWILTTSEYEYYIFEETQEFLQRYCIKKSAVLRTKEQKTTIFNHVLSLDEINQEWQVVEHILQDKYGIYSTDVDIKNGITTPLEAIYFGECALGEELISFPSTYSEYICKIVSWKSEALARCEVKDINKTVKEIIDYIIEFRTCNIKMDNITEEEFNALCHVQLISKVIERNKDIFSVSQYFTNISYQLKVLPYWTFKMIGERFREDTFDVNSLLLYPSELREWIVPCYIFFGAIKDLDYVNFFKVLKNGFLLEYALFYARKANINFCNILYSFLIDNVDYVSSSKSCYAVIYFVYFSPLKIKYKFKLLNCISKKVEKYKLLNLYERVFDFIVGTSCKTKNLKKNMLELINCNVKEINFINGYRTAEVFMQLSMQEGKNIETILWDVVNYILEHDLWQEIRDFQNCGFLDFFIRKCFEKYICITDKQLEDIYKDLSKFFELENPIGIYIKRNLTCASGNIFSSESKNRKGYTEQYIRLVRLYSEKKTLYEKETAYFLIKNSISEESTYINKKLYGILMDLVRKEKDIKKIYEEEKSIFEKEIK